MPEIVFDMLDTLDVQDGYRVLEIGTGTGWTPGLLTARLDGESVTTIEVAAALADPARAALAGVGLGPQVIARDGSSGWPQGAPYDRALCRASARWVPQ